MGVPFFDWWLSGPSDRMGWPLPCLARSQAIIGAPNDTREALISEDGTIDIDPVRFSVEPFIRNGERLFTWADAKLTQSLEDGELPIPSVVRDHGDVKLTVTDEPVTTVRLIPHGRSGDELAERYTVEARGNDVVVLAPK